MVNWSRYIVSRNKEWRFLSRGRFVKLLLFRYKYVYDLCCIYWRAILYFYSVKEINYIDIGWLGY